MARVPQVTRTIVSTKAEVMYVDTVSGATSQISVILPRTYKSNEKMLKVVKEMNTDSKLIPVHIISSETVQNKYGMTEAEFIKYATIIDK